jgi:pyroglutamyl-peptidase
MTTVLITGFGPFPGAPFNPSGLLARALADLRRPGFADVTRIAHVFATRYSTVDRELPGLLARHKPDVVLLFGLAARTPFVRIETRARNAMSVLFADAEGRLPRNRAIAPDGPALRRPQPAVFGRLLRAARATRVETRLSRDAGRYLCNYLYWRALEATAGSAPPIVQFVHIPPVRRPGDTGSRPTLADLERVGEAILRGLLAARR